MSPPDSLPDQLDSLLDEAAENGRDARSALRVYNRLEAALREAPSEVVDDYEIFLAAGRAAARKKLGDHAAALLLCQQWRARALSARDGRAVAGVTLLRVLAQIEAETGNPGQALVTYDDIIATFGTPQCDEWRTTAGDAHIRAARIEDERGNGDTAVARLNTAIELLKPEPDDFPRELLGEALIYKTNALLGLQRKREAIMASDEILKYMADVQTDVARAQVRWATDLRRDVIRRGLAGLLRRGRKS